MDFLRNRGLTWFDHGLTVETNSTVSQPVCEEELYKVKCSRLLDIKASTKHKFPFCRVPTWFRVGIIA